MNKPELVQVRKNGQTLYMKLSPRLRARLAIKQGDNLMVWVTDEGFMVRKLDWTQLAVIAPDNGTAHGG